MSSQCPLLYLCFLSLAAWLHSMVSSWEVTGVVLLLVVVLWAKMLLGAGYRPQHLHRSLQLFCCAFWKFHLKPERRGSTEYPAEMAVTPKPARLKDMCQTGVSEGLGLWWGGLFHVLTIENLGQEGLVVFRRVTHNC